MYLQGATEPYVPDSDAYFSLCGNVLPRQKKVAEDRNDKFEKDGCCVLNMMPMTLMTRRELMVLELHCGNFSATALLNLEFASVMFLLSKVLQGHRGGSKDRLRKHCTHNGAFMLCSITKSAHSTRHRDHYQCEWVICDVHKQNDLHFISFSKQLCRDTVCEALPAVTFILCSVDLGAK